MKRPDNVATAMDTGQMDVIESYIADLEAEVERLKETNSMVPPRYRLRVVCVWLEGKDDG